MSRSQVARRPGYKGKVSGLTSLPVDSCTIPGIITMLATVLPTASLAADAVQECLGVLETLQKHTHVTATWQLLPLADVFAVDVVNNRIQVSSLKAILQELRLSWSRSLGFNSSFKVSFASVVLPTDHLDLVCYPEETNIKIPKTQNNFSRIAESRMSRQASASQGLRRRSRPTMFRTPSVWLLCW